MQAPVQVTVREYVDSFFNKYKCRAYGKTLVSNAKGGAEVLMGKLLGTFQAISSSQVAGSMPLP